MPSSTPDRSAGTGDEPGRVRQIVTLEGEVVACRRCPRLVAWREHIAVEKRASFANDVYWGRPVPSFGDPLGRLLIVGLAPAAHGANRTGRMFTGDRSGDWLFRSLHRTGFASQPRAEHAGDGLELSDAFITASVRCAPPDNKPTAAERSTCRPYLERIMALTPAAVVVALGGLAFGEVLRVGRSLAWPIPRPQPRFGHGVEIALESRTMLASYHPSQQNTFTGRLTEEMLDGVFHRASELISACGEISG